MLERIDHLAIPPAWEDVWVSADERAHLQAAGTDSAGRRQYIYHPEWRRRRATEKFERVEAFARALPMLRARVEQDLRREGLPRERVVACAVRLLDEASFRVGTEAYARQNGSFGLATLHRSHVRFEGRGATFDYAGKGGQRRVQVVRDPGAIRVLRSLCERVGGGRRLLAYQVEDRWRALRSAEINEYLKVHLSTPATAKDFRTWQATVLAAARIAAHTPASAARAVRRFEAGTVKEVAEALGNTPAVCRASYIDPRVFERFEEGITIASRIDPIPSGQVLSRRRREMLEHAVLDLLDGGIRPAEAAA